ncbi:SIR2 family protein [Pseudomonas kuykendallii]|uniref:SIR2-like domain-containing protein n=1 Tax=Pseudomonas kuykendallii TaxID=1007099 RepID=A0A1H2Z869_9PSED|nr:SIR2 family protein [Pseudomonas kuykendallii]MCQ4273508.1 SIR2 family protein [Pseudomonas kuykendallii]SDX13703.1 SIR2-like domain-containing protein [Pseudomonas kuykendallii]
MKEISGRAFATRFALNPSSYAWLLGAGASATAGIPTGYQMIQEFRAQLYASETGISSREIDSSDPLWQERIDLHHERKGILPPKWSPPEYSRAFEALYPTQEDRRLYIKRQVSKGSPSLGHKVLGSLLCSSQTCCVFTTNFDPLIEDSATIAAQLLPSGSRASVTLAAIDNSARAETCLRENEWPLIVKLHGDYQSTELKNTDSELLEQDERLRLVLTQSLHRFGLIVVGYSGRDDSVMQALRAVLADPLRYPKGIYWLCQEPAKLLPAVTEFLSEADSAGVDVHLVCATTFDELLGNIADVTELAQPLVHHVFNSEQPVALASVALERYPALSAPILRLSALPLVAMPSSARKITLDPTVSVTEIRALLKENRAKGVVGFAGKPGVLAAFGDDEALIRALSSLGAKLSGEVSLNISKDPWAKGVIYDALMRALCSELPLSARLQARGHSLSVSWLYPGLSADLAEERRQQLAKLRSAYGTDLTGLVPGTTARYAEGVWIRLEEADSHWWVVFEPATFIDFTKTERDGDSALAAIEHRNAEDWRRERWVQKYNHKWSAIFDAWVELLTYFKGVKRRAYRLEDGRGIGAEFELGPRTARSRPSHDHDSFQVRGK